MGEGSGRLMKISLVTLALVLGVLATVPAAARAQNGSGGGDQYGGEDQYGHRGVGDRAEEDAVMASGTFSVVVTDESSEEGAALAAEPAPPEATPAEDATAEAAEGGHESDGAGESGSAERPDITELPDTGGASSLVLGVLLVSGGLLVGVRALFR